MKPNPLIVRICHLPRDFRRIQTKSAIQLLRDCGFYDQVHNLDIAEINQVLNDDPTLVRDWLNWSADKRVSEGWFLLENGTVGRVGLPGRAPATKCDSLALACAEFIVRELEEFRRYAE